MIQRAGPPAPPIYDKIQPEHLDRMFDLQSEIVQANERDRKHSRKTALWFVGIVAAVVVVIAGMAIFSGAPDLIEEIIKLGAVAGGALGAGYGIRTRKETTE